MAETPRRQRRDDAVDPGDASAECDQREHIEMTCLKRSPAPLEERPAAPNHHRRRKQELKPRIERWRDDTINPEEMTAHLKKQHRNCDDRAHDEATAHVSEFRIWARFRARRHRLQRHAADRARAWAVAHDLGMHRACPFDARRRVRGRRSRPVLMRMPAMLARRTRMILRGPCVL